MPKIAPSLLAADFLDLNSAVRIVDAAADYYHMDVMDGIFVPNISFGFPVIDAIAAVAEKPLDVHLMITDPAKYALKLAAIPSVEMVSFHLEALPEPVGLLSQIKAAGKKAGLVVNPDFPLETLFRFLPYCDFVLIMSVFAGFGGQKFIEDTYGRVRATKEEITRLGLNVEIEVDGGIGLSNAQLLSEAGADILVSGTSVFKAEDPCGAIRAMQ